MAKFKSDFLNTLDERGFIHQCSDFAGLDALAAKGEAVAYVGYDCTAPSLHIGNFLTIMMLYWLQQSGNKPDHADGRRHHSGGRPLGQGRDARHPAGRGDRGQQGEHQGRVLQDLEVRRRQDRRRHARQRGVADQAQLHRHAARHRPALLGQPHADHGLGAPAARARAGDELHRVQLHDLPGLRFRRAGPAHRLQPADGRLRPVGQHRHGRRSRPAHGHAPALCADHAAAADRLGRQDGQDRAGRRVAQRGADVGLRLLAVLAQHRGRRRRPSSSSCSRPCRWRRSTGSRR